MATIGQFRAVENGFESTISTLSMARKVQIIPNENKKSDQSPDFFVKTGQCDLGFARHQMSEGENLKPFISVFLEDPSFVEPIWAALFEKKVRRNWSGRDGGPIEHD